MFPLVRGWKKAFKAYDQRLRQKIKGYASIEVKYAVPKLPKAMGSEEDQDSLSRVERFTILSHGLHWENGILRLRTAEPQNCTMSIYLERTSYPIPHPLINKARLELHATRTRT
ncbi:hypothetical protein PoB_005697800 [Plakobranchus ocellatus]|uniref:Uncharacterized protein n=1 Tax=Plakobranchus ocellatus TaxID=259542 RepID=A0AAV4CEV7_9GAST|nr:hypothetical protein PoB_005697800 [Plakobranchus ocellatus]